MKKKSVTVRIMWNDEHDKDLAAEIAKIVLVALREHGFTVNKSKVYRNRKNTGGRIYITISLRKAKRAENQYEEQTH